MKPILVLTQQQVHQLTQFLNYVIIALFFLGVALLVYYQLGYLLATHGSLGFTEPDNYMYLLFAQMAIAHPTLNPIAIPNPYLLQDVPLTFFEHPGLLLMPVWLYDITHIPLVWDFRIIQILTVIGIYVMTLLLVKIVLDRTPVSKTYRYLAYTLVITSSLLMQYTEITQWRGNVFITALCLAEVLLLGYAFTNPGKRSILFILATVGLWGFAAWIWQGGLIVAYMGCVLIPALAIYYIFLRKHPGFWRWFALILIVASIFLYFGYGIVDTYLIPLLSHFSIPNCNVNPLHEGEVACLTSSNGLTAVLMMFVFGCFGIIAFISNTIMSNQKDKYEHYLIGVIVIGIALLPVALVYLRMLSVLSPFLSIFYALGVVALFTYFTKIRSNRIVISLVVILILIAAFVGQYLFYLANLTLYNFANPVGLIGVGGYLQAYPNASVFTYWGYGDWLESQHFSVYADTIQGSDAPSVLPQDLILMSNPQQACTLLASITPTPDFVLLGGTINQSVLFINASNDSLVADPLGFNGVCGYDIVYEGKGFYLFKR